LRIEVETQLKWKTEWDAFREWRAAIERNNILVFQLPMPVEDARGFSLADEDPYAIVVSSSDAVRARIFTLFHEYGHLLLHTSGICLPQLDGRSREHGAELERWCNSFAGAFLVPDPALSRTVQSGQAELEGQALYDAMGNVAREFKVSEQAALLRLRELGMVPRQSFHVAMEKLAARGKGVKKGGGAVPPAKRCVAENGPLFTSLVLEARGNGLVTYSDVADYLDVRLKHLPEIESSLAAVAA
jgi:Zn-dependent peptidase ImmA (M78 family)